MGDLAQASESGFLSICDASPDGEANRFVGTAVPFCYRDWRLTAPLLLTIEAINQFAVRAARWIRGGTHLLLPAQLRELRLCIAREHRALAMTGMVVPHGAGFRVDVQALDPVAAMVLASGSVFVAAPPVSEEKAIQASPSAKRAGVQVARALPCVHGESVGKIEVASDASLFDEHFPGFPVLPGSFTLEHAVQLLLSVISEREGGVCRAVTFKKINFVHPVGPGETLDLHLDQWRGGSDRGSARIALKAADRRTVLDGVTAWELNT